MLSHSNVIYVLVIVISFAATSTASDGNGVAMSELEYLVGELSYAECQQLADILRADFGSKAPEEGVTCLDDLIRQQSELEDEGSNIARGIFRHKLNQIGRQDLAEWLSIVRDPISKSRARNTNTIQTDEGGGVGGGKSGGVNIFGKSSPKSWCEIAVTIALLYTAGLLIWLTIRILLCRMKRELRTRGLANNGLHGYSYYYPARMDEDQGSPFHAQPPVPSQQHYYQPQPTASSKSIPK